MTEFTHLFIWNRISGRSWENEEEVILKELMIEKFPELMKYINPQIENHSEFWAHKSQCINIINKWIITTWTIDFKSNIGG